MKPKKPELYFSVDIEADGPCPGVNSMLSIGAGAFSYNGMRGPDFSINLAPLPGASIDEDTYRWWQKNSAAYLKATEHQTLPDLGTLLFVDWVESFTEWTPVFVGYPAGFDFTFVYWYCHRFVGRCPFGFQALDIKSFAMAVLGTDFKETTKKTMPKEWFPKMRHTHVALDDAIEQGELFVNILNHARERNRS